MWRTNKFTENEDSDLSLSDEVDFVENLPEDCVSLGGSSKKKEEVQVLSQLEMLRGLGIRSDPLGFFMNLYDADGCELVQDTGLTISAMKRQTDVCVEDDVEFPSFANEDHFLCLPRGDSIFNSDEEIISDDEVRQNDVQSTKFISWAKNFLKVERSNSGITREADPCTWSAANREAEALLHLNENASRSSSRPIFSKSNMSLKGGQGRAKPKVSFYSHPNKKDWSRDVDNITDSCISSKERRIEELEVRAVTAEMALRDGNGRQSMVELLGCFQDNNALQQGTTKQIKRKDAQFSFKRGKVMLGDRNMEGDPEGLDSGSSTDDEDKQQSQKLILLKSTQKTMADQFQEALGAASTSDKGHLNALPSHFSTGLFGKLQQVMQREKERDVDFSNRLLMEDKGSCMDVKILSKFLEAKLTVCSCFCIRDNESSQWAENHLMMKEMEGRTLTIIFCSRICSDVDLEVGNIIRVHLPWREVHVMGKDESTILSAYFSQI